MRVPSFAAVAFVALTLPGAALAQGTPPATPPSGSAPSAAATRLNVPRTFQPRVRDSAFALSGAYREIGRAENAGASGHYVDAARSHYRSALARHDRNDDAGAAAEARLASDLARVAVDERPRNASGPKDVPAPPTPRPMQARGSGMTAMSGGGAWRGMDGAGGPGGPGRMPMMRVAGGRGFGMHGGHGFDAARLAAIMKVETGAEARQLAQNAVDANSAAQRAALAGNVEEAARQTRISGDLVAAVRDLAALNHPDQMRSQMPTIQMRVFGDGMPMPMTLPQ
jgi:hypothetical protein